MAQLIVEMELYSSFFKRLNRQSESSTHKLCVRSLGHTLMTKDGRKLCKTWFIMNNRRPWKLLEWFPWQNNFIFVLSSHSACQIKNSFSEESVVFPYDRRGRVNCSSVVNVVLEIPEINWSSRFQQSSFRVLSSPPTYPSFLCAFTH